MNRLNPVRSVVWAIATVAGLGAAGMAFHFSGSVSTSRDASAMSVPAGSSSTPVLGTLESD